MRFIVQQIVLVLALAVPVAAQDRAGRDTPGEWKVTHYKAFGLWDSICDERRTGDVLEERCYLRYVEVFSPRPRFAAQFVFITLSGTPEIDIGLERGTRFPANGLRVEGDDGVLWSTDRRSCLRGGNCRFTGNAAEPLFNALSAGKTFAFDFIDRHGSDRSLRWDLGLMKDALDDLSTETRRRNL